MPLPHNHHRLSIYHHCLSATALNPYPYTTTNPYPYTTTNPYPYTTTATIYHHHISTTNPSSSHIRFVFEIHLNSDSCFPCLRRSRKKKNRAQNFPKTHLTKIFLAILFLGVS